MRKLILVISALCGIVLCLAAENFLPFAEKGRKWVWGWTRYDYNFEEYHSYSETIIGDTLINGEKYATALYQSNGNESIGYIKEDNGVWLKSFIDTYTREETTLPWIDMHYHKGDTVTVVPLEHPDTLYYSIIDESIMSLRGVNRKILKLTDRYAQRFGYWIEGIGPVDDKYILFSYPMSSCCFSPYELEACYDGDVCIYRKGDLPLTPAGVGEVSVDASAESPAQYFDLQGRPVNAEQLAPGLYIRRTGSRTEKIIIR